ncbi:PRA1 family protein D-like [Andrographis paniculata]|uniref:PRA1 family protein D-like n=1 Tax=Andrographis paniculata TaxID=175694 RepID=UPI0021E8E564|nr:PRA1 family protein D-like [Andrographis paniculata]
MSSPAPPTATADADAGKVRPWGQFLEISALSIPVSLSEASFRITQNLRYFLPNYALLTLGIFLVSLIVRPLALIFFLFLFAAWIYLVFLRDEPLSVFDCFVDQKIVMGILAVITLLALFWTKLWLRLFVCLIVGALVVLIHGALRAPEDSMEDSPYGSLLNVVEGQRGEYASV